MVTTPSATGDWPGEILQKGVPRRLQKGVPRRIDLNDAGSIAICLPCLLRDYIVAMIVRTRGKACFFESLGAEPGDWPEACGSSGGAADSDSAVIRQNTVATPWRRLLPPFGEASGRDRTLPNHRRIAGSEHIRASCPITDSRIVKSMAPSNARAGRLRLGRQAINSMSLTSTAGHPQLPSQVDLGMVWGGETCRASQ